MTSPTVTTPGNGVDGSEDRPSAVVMKFGAVYAHEGEPENAEREICTDGVLQEDVFERRPARILLAQEVEDVRARVLA
jgi:hypothetical protein